MKTTNNWKIIRLTYIIGLMNKMWAKILEQDQKDHNNKKNSFRWTFFIILELLKTWKEYWQICLDSTSILSFPMFEATQVTKLRMADSNLSASSRETPKNHYTHLITSRNPWESKVNRIHENSMLWRKYTVKNK